MGVGHMDQVGKLVDHHILHVFGREEEKGAR
jgi:hypothetical protein